LIAITSLVVIVAVALLVTRMGALALTATGMPADIARFQARSAFTGVGFTTSESEAVVRHPVRRRIVMVLMTVGNAGFVTIVASLILSFSTTTSTGNALLRLLLIVAAMSGLAFLTRTALFQQRVTSLLAKLLDRYSSLELRDFHHMMRLGGEYAVVELGVEDGDWLASKSLFELELSDEGVLVLAVQTANGEFLGVPRGQTTINAGDTLVLYGRTSSIADLDTRPDTPRGDRAHDEAVAEQDEILEEEAEGNE